MTLLLEIKEISAFTAPARIRGVTRSRSVQQPSSLPAKKKRRRRKGSSDSSEMDDPSLPASDELPEFDLGDDDGASAKVSKQTTESNLSSDPMGEISSAMMGTTNQPVRSVDQLIADRSLEKNFEFDEPAGDEALPDLAVLAKQQEAGRKRTKRDARVAAALERKEQDDDDVNPLSKIPFFVDDDGEVSAIKVRTIDCVFLHVGRER